ncbi:hypothetical protein [Caenispirillum salinarum]|nr:hypothetical protein [Caenispirillum salinarum]
MTTKADLTREQVLKFRDFLCEVPYLVNRSIYRKGMTVQQQVALAKKMDDLKARAARGDRAAKRQIAERLTGKTSIEDVTRRLSLKTINRYLSQLGQIFEKPLDERGDQKEVHPEAFFGYL